MSKILLPLLLLLPSLSFASTEYICTARIDCGAPRLPSTQDLPSIQTPIVRSDSLEAAKGKCLTQYTSAYYRLTKSLGQKDSLFREAKSCQILSEAMPL